MGTIDPVALALNRLNQLKANEATSAANDLEVRIDSMSVVVSDPDLTSYALKAELSSTPITEYWNGTAWSPREATNRPKHFYGGPAMPLPNGSTTGGGGMIPNKDLWFGIV